jgi:hypothetical protein
MGGGGVGDGMRREFRFGEACDDERICLCEGVRLHMTSQ